jgi:hypothetical protein
VSLADLDRAFNPRRWPAFPAKAIEGEGVRDCLTAIFKLSISHIGRARAAQASGGSVGTPVLAGAASVAGPAATAEPAARVRSPLAGPGRPPSKPRPVTPVGRPRWNESPV